MRLVQNTGNDRVVNMLRDWLVPGSAVDVMSPAFSIYAFAPLLKAGTGVGAHCNYFVGMPRLPSDSRLIEIVADRGTSIRSITSRELND